MSLSVATFEDQLFRRLGREYRLRWSSRKETFAIEQKVDQPKMSINPIIRKKNPEQFERLRDGYVLVCEVAPAPTMRCNRCGERLEVPALEWKEVKCSACYAHRERANTQFYVAYFPLCERLLQHLESTSPKRGYAWVKDMLEGNAKVKATQQRDWENHTEAGLKDYMNVIADNPVIGYGNGPAKFGRI